ncbi:cytochrome P450 [Kibdelosporangium philippinense]|uniref:Cytochrome P450 n=1 Tax=Kibdelosporangium philippinense TaxID=211113 RepID=A0ABS8Z5H0_9PSEU|nr:cytochrome P450 [Kibdelosporangium philippinense]MCE7003105.1 cytochrome P450 [Kibdelosporangium philippinense]
MDSIDATVAELSAEPHELLARLREHAPVSWLPSLNGWLVTRHAEAVRVMRNPAVFTVDDPRFSTAQVVGPSMLSLDGADHARHRAPFASAFRPAAVRTRFADFVTAEAERLVTSIKPAGTAELRRGIAGPLAVSVVAKVLGLGDVEISKVLAWYDAIVGAVSGVSEGNGVNPAGIAAFGQLSARVRETIALRNDSVLADAAGLTADEIVSNAAVMMFGGIETTEGMITNAVWHLLECSDGLGQVASDSALLENAVEESLRFEPAAAVVDRYATQDVDLGGASIRRGDLVVVSITGANRDPLVFPDPDVFDVRRPNARQHLAFAHGPHVCVAADLARLETRTAIKTLAANLPDFRLTHAERPTGLVFRKPQALHVEWSIVD